ncbi:unnamed protein product [Dibothriocephalus latus]|uniref:Uncharacterized protein n=1 Tax=Dibothriocephalus latus TaxID=60516 RepID=A0A3P7P8N7_DIBLA|nr:unnamed protein product [Dibothriocephalus latus]
MNANAASQQFYQLRQASQMQQHLQGGTGIPLGGVPVGGPYLQYKSPRFFFFFFFLLLLVDFLVMPPDQYAAVSPTLLTTNKFGELSSSQSEIADEASVYASLY